MDGEPQAIPATLAALASALGVEVAGMELSGVRIQGPVVLPPSPVGANAPSAASWSLGPLAAANGAVRAQIVDAQLVFDADVTVPIREGSIHFDDASVEHVGPDSRMGVSKLGIYVDAPNGRSYLYQFASAPVAGVAYEQRGGLLAGRASSRGNLRLQDFAEALLRQGPDTHGPGFTDQARVLFDRTAVSGEVRLGDGRLAVPGVEAQFAGRAQGHNAVRLQSDAVGRGLAAEVASLSVRQVVATVGGMQVECDEVTGTLKLRLFREGAQLRFAFDLGNVRFAGLRLRSA
jgi:hypothetical protein